MGRPQARLLPATTREKSAAAAAGAMRQRRPRTAASKTQPQIVRKGMYPILFEIGLKKLENGRAPSRENAQVCLDAATRIERPMAN